MKSGRRPGLLSRIYGSIQKHSGIYSAGRMLYTLAKNGQAPKFFGKVPESGVPGNSIITTISLLLLGVLFNYLMPDSKLFLYIYSASILPGMVPWFALAVSQFKFRTKRNSEMGVHPLPVAGAGWHVV